MAGFIPIYGASSTVFGANDLDGLAASSTLLAGWESAVITNASNDVMIAGRFRVNGVTAPTAGQIVVYAGTSLNDTPAYPDVFDGTASAETITSADIRNSILTQIAAINTDTTTGRTYEFHQRNLAKYFGGAMPQKYFIFVTHSTGQTLHATAGNGGQCWITPITYPA